MRNYIHITYWVWLLIHTLISVKPCWWYWNDVICHMCIEIFYMIDGFECTSLCTRHIIMLISRKTVNFHLEKQITSRLPMRRTHFCKCSHIFKMTQWHWEIVSMSTIRWNETVSTQISRDLFALWQWRPLHTHLVLADRLFAVSS